MPSEPKPATTRIAITCLALLAVAAVVRVLFVHAMELPHSDPWRHLILLRNVHEGLGFTLFAGQPYIWYSPVWYHLAAALAAPEQVKWLAAAFSTLAVPLFALYLFRLGDDDWVAAGSGGILMAAFGPMVTFTSQLGAEAFAIFLLVLALLLAAAGRGIVSGLASGLCFGLSLAARLQFVFDVLLFVPLFASRRRGGSFLVGAALPLALHWARNFGVLRSHPWVFTWDGMATRSSEYGPISTLAVQLHPAVAEATRRLYERILELPEWLYFGGRIRWEMLLFMGVALACVLASRRIWLILTALVTIFFFFFFDDTLSSRFFRIWLGLLPVLFSGVAHVASRLAGRAPSARWAVVGAGVVAITLTGLPDLRPRPAIPIEAATPPQTLLTETHYLVASGYYHPESLLFRYPGRAFIGMPLDPDQFEDFRRHFPEYRAVIWHGFHVQTELLARLTRSEGYETTRTGRNTRGYPYRIMQAR
jgi:hypothetical protein